MSVLDFQVLFDASPNAYLVLDRSLSIVAANEAYLALVGGDLEEFRSRGGLDALLATDPTAREQMIASVEHVFETRMSDTIDVARLPMRRRTEQDDVHREGRWSLTHSPIVDAEGSCTFVLQHALDVTPHRRFESRTNRTLAASIRSERPETFDRAESDTGPSPQEERVHLVQLLQQMPGFAAVLNGPEHVYEYVNNDYVTIAGSRDFLGRTVREVFPELAGQGFYELLDEVYSSGRRFEARSLPIRMNGEDADRFVDLLYQPIRNSSGLVTGIFAGGYDVSEHVRAQAALAESEMRYRTLFESIDVGFCIVEMKFDETGKAVDYRIEEANPAFERQTGADVTGLWVSQFAPNLERHWFDTYGRVALTGEPAHFENHADVFDRWFDVRALRLGEPAARRVAIFFSDISERKIMIETLHTLNATLETRVEERTAERDRMWETSPDLLAVIDFDGVFHRVNPAWTSRLGYTPAELIGHHVNEFVMPGDHAQTSDAYATTGAGEQVAIENRYRHKDGSTRWISWVAAPFGGMTYGLGRDVTEERLRRTELEAAQEALRQSHKMEAVGQLTGGLAHDFNNLLAGISGSLDLIQTRIRQGRTGEIDRYLTGAQGAARRAAALTHRLLAFSRRQTLDPKPTNVDRLVAGMEDMIRRTVGPSIAVETVATAGLWSTLVDPPQLENALLNLCINARDAMPEGGRITVETGNCRLDKRAARERDLPPGEYVSMCVSDNGTGMPPDVIERAFDPFFTTKPIGVGTGLGLSMIYGFARQSGGQVRIESQVGRGSTVCIYLPRHDVQETEEPTVSLAPPERVQSGKTVLVIDDEPLVRMLVVDVLEDLGFTAIEAGDGPQGLQVLRTDVHLDLLITDVGLPNGMNGRQVADAARELRPGLKVLFVTGYAENAVLGQSQLDSGMQVVTKPFDMTALANRIREMIFGA